MCVLNVCCTYRPQTVIALLQRMKKENVIPNTIVLTAAIDSLAREGGGTHTGRVGVSHLLHFTVSYRVISLGHPNEGVICLSCPILSCPLLSYPLYRPPCFVVHGTEIARNACIPNLSDTGMAWHGIGPSCHCSYPTSSSVCMSLYQPSRVLLTASCTVRWMEPKEPSVSISFHLSLPIQQISHMTLTHLRPPPQHTHTYTYTRTCIHTYTHRWSLWNTAGHGSKRTWT